VISNSELAAWRKEYFRCQMHSAIWEYCPTEFLLLLDEVEKLRAEIERLRAEFDEAKGGMDYAITASMDEAERLRAENEAMRVVLHNAIPFIEGCYPHVRETMEKALALPPSPQPFHRLSQASHKL
jgi:hypothetical protein